MKRTWDPTTLTVHFWTGIDPNPGDGLETSTGRRYLILRVKRSSENKIRALECLVLPKGEPIEGRLFSWVWSPRRRKPR